MAALLPGLLLAALPAASHADSLVTTIVTDPLTGVAMDGYDPVSYFIEAEPLPGKPDYEYQWEGVSWYFANAANRDAFIRAPDIYAPQYGGYCMMSLARGYLSDGKPGIYLVDRTKLFLFYSTANREAFRLAQAEASKTAAANWPDLAKQLMGPAGEMAASSAEASVAASGDTGSQPADSEAHTADGTNPPVAPAPSAGNLAAN